MARQITVSYEGEPGIVEKQIREAIISVLQKNGVTGFKMHIQPETERGAGEDGEK